MRTAGSLFSLSKLVFARAVRAALALTLATASGCSVKINPLGGYRDLADALATENLVAPGLYSATIANSTPTNSAAYSLAFGPVSGTYSSYCILENDTDVSNCAWSFSALPASYAVAATENAKTLSVWIRGPTNLVSDRVDTNVVTLDQTPPAAPAAGGWSEATPRAAVAVTAAWTKSASGDLAAQQIQFYADGACTTASGGPVSLTAAVQTNAWSAPGSGTYSYVIRSADAAGNSSNSPCASAMVVDTVPPASPAFSAFDPASPSSNANPKVKGTASADTATLEIFADAACTSSLATGTKADFEGAGIPISVGAGSTTPVHAKSFDALGNASACTSLAAYQHLNTMNLVVPLEVTVGPAEINGATNEIFWGQLMTMDPADYDGTTTYSFEIVASNTAGVDGTVTLMYTGDNSLVSIAVPPTAGSRRRLRTTFTPIAGSNFHYLRLTSTTGNLRVDNAQILVKQVAATKTKLYYPLVQGAYNGAGFTSHTDQSGSTAYTQGYPPYYSTWRKDNSKIADLAAGSPWRFQAVMRSASNGITTNTALFNKTTNQMVAGSELTSTIANAGEYHVDLADGATNFADLNDFEARIRTQSGGGDSSERVMIYRAGIWVTLTNLSKARSSFRCTTANQITPTTFNMMGYRFLYTAADFTSPVIRLGVSGSTDGTQSRFRLVDDNAFEEGDFNAGASIVSGSSALFSTGAKAYAESGTFSLVDGHRYWIIHDRTGGTETWDSGCFIHVDTSL